MSRIGNDNELGSDFITSRRETVDLLHLKLERHHCNFLPSFNGELCLMYFLVWYLLIWGWVFLWLWRFWLSILWFCLIKLTDDTPI